MPELPEVETTRLALQLYLQGQTIRNIIIRNPNLRWKIANDLIGYATGRTLNELQRRGKYLILIFDQGGLIIHLGMSGSLRVLKDPEPAQKHDHVDIYFDRYCLRYTDPRRFGSMHWIRDEPESHWLLSQMGVEPLTRRLHGQYLYTRAKGRKIPIKLLTHYLQTQCLSLFTAIVSLFKALYMTLCQNRVR